METTSQRAWIILIKGRPFLKAFSNSRGGQRVQHDAVGKMSGCTPPLKDKRKDIWIVLISVVAAPSLAKFFQAVGATRHLSYKMFILISACF